MLVLVWVGGVEVWEDSMATGIQWVVVLALVLPRRRQVRPEGCVNVESDFETGWEDSLSIDSATRVECRAFGDHLHIFDRHVLQDLGLWLRSREQCVDGVRRQVRRGNNDRRWFS